jgi:hypothetical protein
MVDDINDVDDLNLDDFNFDDLPSIDDLPSADDLPDDKSLASLAESANVAEARKEPFFEKQEEPVLQLSELVDEGGKVGQAEESMDNFPFVRSDEQAYSNDASDEFIDNEPVAPVEPAPWDDAAPSLSEDIVPLSDMPEKTEEVHQERDVEDFAVDYREPEAEIVSDAENESMIQSEPEAEQTFRNEEYGFAKPEPEDVKEVNYSVLEPTDDNDVVDSVPAIEMPEDVAAERVGPKIDDVFSNNGIVESSGINFLRAYSGTSSDAMFELEKGFVSSEFCGDEQCQTIHIDVGYDTYGWTVSFDNGVEMNVRDVREYQIRHGCLPASSGKIVYGQSCLTFSNVSRIVVFETVRYFSYGM